MLHNARTYCKLHRLGFCFLVARAASNKWRYAALLGRGAPLTLFGAQVRLVLFAVAHKTFNPHLSLPQLAVLGVRLSQRRALAGGGWELRSPHASHKNSGSFGGLGIGKRRFMSFPYLCILLAFFLHFFIFFLFFASLFIYCLRLVVKRASQRHRINDVGLKRYFA